MLALASGTPGRAHAHDGAIREASTAATLADASARSERSRVSDTARCTRIRWLEVRKSERSLRAWCADGATVDLRIALGPDARGPKRMRGDGRTPEGYYRVKGPAHRGEYHRFVAIDYPSRVDAAEALARGTISEETFREIVAAHEATRLPPQDTILGGHLGIHGEGDQWRGSTARADWTQGCIGVTDAEIDFLAARLPPGTPVVILP